MIKTQGIMLKTQGTWALEHNRALQNRTNKKPALMSSWCPYVQLQRCNIAPKSLHSCRRDLCLWSINGQKMHENGTKQLAMQGHVKCPTQMLQRVIIQLSLAVKWRSRLKSRLWRKTTHTCQLDKIQPSRVRNHIYQNLNFPPNVILQYLRTATSHLFEDGLGG